MREAIDETSRRREKQQAHNTEHGITPVSIVKEMDNILDAIYSQAQAEKPLRSKEASFVEQLMEQAMDEEAADKAIKRLEREMRVAAKDLAFERAAELRDAITVLKTRSSAKDIS